MKILNELKDLLPPLRTKEFQQLEENCLQYGIRDEIITWKGTIIDGHNRYAIAMKHNISFKTSEMEFDTIEDVRHWMVLNQFSRRNLNVYNRVRMALLLEDSLKKKAKENQGNILLKSTKGLNVRNEIAKIAGTSPDTVRKVKYLKNFMKQDLIDDKTTINKAYNFLKIFDTWFKEWVRCEVKTNEILRTDISGFNLDELHDIDIESRNISNRIGANNVRCDNAIRQLNNLWK